MGSKYIKYVPNANFNGTDTFTFKANDGTADTNTATVTVTVTAVNDAPTSSAVSASTNEDTVKAITLVGADVDGDNLTYSVVSNPSNGSLGFGSNTSPGVNYSPSANFNGTDTFTYKVNDGTADSNTSTVTITVAAVNDAPVTTDQTASTDEDTAVDVTLSSTDVEGDSVTYSIVSDVSNGSTSLSGSTVTYTPAANYNGTDTFTFKANDGTVDSNVSTVTITVAAVNDAPTLDDITFTVQKNNNGQNLNGNYSIGPLSSSYSDVDGDSATSQRILDASNLTGFVQNQHNPLVHFAGKDYAEWQGDFANEGNMGTFTFTVADGTVDSNEATATIIINPNTAPSIPNDASGSMDEDSGTLTLNLSSSADAEGDDLVFSNAYRGSGSGLFTISGTTITYTPDTNWSGTATFGYRSFDGLDYSCGDGSTSSTSPCPADEVGTITVTVNAVNDVPTTINQSSTVGSGSSRLDISGYSDVETPDLFDGTSGLTFSVVSGVSNGTLGNFGEGVASNGAALKGNQILYQPNVGFTGTDTFTYKVNDGTDDSNISTFTITVQ